MSDATAPTVTTTADQKEKAPDLLFGRFYVNERTRYIIRQLFTRPTSVAGLLLVGFFVVVAVAAPVLAPPENPNTPFTVPRDGFRSEPQPPSAEHIFGTTEGQYDIYYALVWGTRTAFQVGLIVTGITFVIGMVIGSVAGYFGGMVDDVLMRFVEIVITFPFLLAAITMASVLGSRMGNQVGQIVIGGNVIYEGITLNGITVGIIALIAFGWPGYARLIRGDILSIKERDYVLAAKSIGASDPYILFKYVIPNAIFATLVVASMNIGDYVLTFAALSFLGLGAEPSYADWGQIISFARNWIPSLDVHSHILIYPGAAILLFVLGWNLIGDAFRDIIDPRLSGSRGS